MTNQESVQTRDVRRKCHGGGNGAPSCPLMPRTGQVTPGQLGSSQTARLAWHSRRPCRHWPGRPMASRHH